MTDTNTAEREAFEAECKKLFACTTLSFMRDNGVYFNAVCRSFFGKSMPAYADVSMLWEVWKAARASLAASAGSEPVAWRLRNTAFRSEVYEYFKTKYLAECRQKQFNASVDDGGLHDLTPLYTHPFPPEGMAGWKLVPIEPTVDQEWEGKEASRRVDSMAEACKIYKAMIDASPPLPASEAKEL